MIDPGKIFMILIFGCFTVGIVILYLALIAIISNFNDEQKRKWKNKIK